MLGLLAEGHSYQAAADLCQVSINTIRDYIRSIYDKLHVHSKTEAQGSEEPHHLLIAFSRREKTA